MINSREVRRILKESASICANDQDGARRMILKHLKFYGYESEPEHIRFLQWFPHRKCIEVLVRKGSEEIVILENIVYDPQAAQAARESRRQSVRAIEIAGILFLLILLGNYLFLALKTRGYIDAVYRYLGDLGALL